jgi:membrane fusion protein (multidrug efflux system)
MSIKMNKNRIYLIGALTVLLFAAFALRFVDGAGDDDPAAMHPAAVAVEVTAVAPADVTETVSAVGTIEARMDVTVESETAGRITAVHFNTGDRVSKGQVLVTVDDELKGAAADQARAQALAAETQAQKSARDLERAETLHKTQDVSDAELEACRLASRSAEAGHRAALAALKAAERQLSDTRIKSPIAGEAASRLVEEGEMVTSGKKIADIVDLGSVKVKLSIAEKDIVKLRTGQAASMELDASPGSRYTGKVTAVGAKTESSTGHTFPVEVTIDGDGSGRIRAGMFARVEITAGQYPGAIAIPREWLVNEETNPAVFVAYGGVAKAVPVTIASRSGGTVRIVSGLNAGDLVVSFGQKGLTDGTPITYKR